VDAFDARCNGITEVAILINPCLNKLLLILIKPLSLDIVDLFSMTIGVSLLEVMNILKVFFFIC
jgi:hypothetical protein